MQIATHHRLLPSHASIPEPLRPSNELLAAWLLVLVQAGVAHGYDMRRELAARRLAVDYPSVYRMLNKLQRDGRLRSHWGKTVAGPRRRLYEITPAGVESLAELADRLGALSQTLDRFFDAYAQTAALPDGDSPGPPQAPMPQSTRRDVDLLALDHLALAVEDLDAMQAFLCDHIGMQELGRGGGVVVVGADVRATKLRLIPVEGPREPAALGRLVLGVSDLQRAAAALPADTEVQRQGPQSISLEGPEGLELGFTLALAGEIERDIVDVILRVADPDETATALAALGCARDGNALHVGDKRLTLEELPAWSDRPLLDHVAVRADSIQVVAARARHGGYQIDERPAGTTIAIVLPGPERITVEFFEDHA